MYELSPLPRLASRFIIRTRRAPANAFVYVYRFLFLNSTVMRSFRILHARALDGVLE